MSQSSQQSAAPPALPFDPQLLRDYLRERVTGMDGDLQLTGFKGGQSHPTFLLQTSARRFVLPTKPGPRSKLLPSAHAMECEYRVQSAVAASNVPVAGMHLLCEDQSVIGRAFCLMDHVEGRIFWDASLAELDRAERGAIYDELNRVIGLLHRVDPASLGLSDYGKHDGYVARQINRWRRQYNASRSASVEAMDRLIGWLPANTPADDGSSALVHGHYRIDNVIFHPTQSRILAVIDWELSTLGHPLADFAYHLMAWHIPPGPPNSAGRQYRWPNLAGSLRARQVRHDKFWMSLPVS